MSPCFRKGQSLIELAIFSSIIIFSLTVLVGYALSFNFNQRIMMQSFKRAMFLADQASTTSLSASATLVYDKAIANPSSMFGVGSRSGITFSFSGTRSNDLYSEMEGLDYELSRTVYDINGKVYTFKTAAFAYKDLAGAKRKAVIDYWNGQGLSWQWEYPDADDDEKKFENNTQWDIDNDGEEETILNTDTGLVMDSQEGEIDSTVSDPELTNGLLSESRSIKSDQNELTNTQNRRNFSTRSKLRDMEIIERKIRLNPRLTNLSNITAQIEAQNSTCSYASGYSCDRFSINTGCDCLLLEGGEKLLLVRSVFSSDKNAFEWDTHQ